MSSLRDASFGSAIMSRSAAGRLCWRWRTAVVALALCSGQSDGGAQQPMELPPHAFEQLQTPALFGGQQLPPKANMAEPLPSPPQPSPMYPPPAHPAPRPAGPSMPWRLPPTHCDEPGPVGHPPAPPAPCPPKRQVHHIYLQPEQQPAEQPAVSAPSQLPAGAFVAPPQSGAVVEEQNSLGIRGLRITFPSLTFELPSIELPHWIRRGRAAHMELAGGTAPYVAGAGQPALPQMAALPSSYRHQAPAQQPAQQPAQAAAEQPACDQQPSLQEDFEALQARCRRLEQLLEKMVQCQSQPILQPPPAQPCPPPLHRIPPPQQACPPGLPR